MIGSPALIRAALASFALLLASYARAADYYACDCGPGADAQCVAGSDVGTGTSPASPWRSYDRAQDQFAALPPGDGIHFCRGGVFAITGSTAWVNTQCTASLRCTVGAYAAPWASGDEARPRLMQTAGFGFNLANGGSAQRDGGYVLRDLELVCSACASGQWGVFLFNDVDDVRMERLTIRNFSIGVHLAGSNPCGPDPGCDGRSSRIEMLDSELSGNFDQGWLGAGDDLLLADNRLLGNGSESVFQHNLYLSQSGGATQRIRVLRNELYRSAAANGSCEGGSFAVHGEHTDLLIEGNLIREDLGAADPACWGLGVTPAYATPEAFVRTIIRGNTFRNVGNVAIALASCSDCIVENNVVVHGQSFGALAVLAPAVAREPDDQPMSRLTVRNNSVYSIAGGSTGLRVGGEGTGHVVVSNALQNTATSGSWACLSLDLAPAAYAAVDYNVCGYVAGAGREWEQGSGALAAWRIASGFDTASVDTAPGFANPAALDLAAASAAAPIVGAGDPLRSAPTEIGGAPRDGDPDSGAHEFGVETTLFADGFE